MEPDLTRYPAGNIACAPCKNDACFMKRCLPTWERLLLHEKKAFKVPRKSAVFQQGVPVHGIFFVLEGKVKVFSTGSQGREQIIRLASDGDILGHRGYSGGMEYGVSAVALTDTVVCFLEREVFLSLMRMNNDLAFTIAFFYGEELGRMDAWLRQSAELTMKQKLAEALLMIRDAFGTEADGKTLGYAMSRRDLANIAGSVPDVVSRLLAELVRDGVIELTGKQIVVADFGMLEAAAGRE